MQSSKLNKYLIHINWRSVIFYYELDESYIDILNLYLYDSTYNYFLAAISKRVFKLENNTLLCVSGDVTFFKLEPKETTFIILSAHPYNGKVYDYFDPGHA